MEDMSSVRRIPPDNMWAQGTQNDCALPPTTRNGHSEKSDISDQIAPVNWTDSVNSNEGDNSNSLRDQISTQQTSGTPTSAEERREMECADDAYSSSSSTNASTETSSEQSTRLFSLFEELEVIFTSSNDSMEIESPQCRPFNEEMLNMTVDLGQHPIMGFEEEPFDVDHHQF